MDSNLEIDDNSSVPEEEIWNFVHYNEEGYPVFEFGFPRHALIESNIQPKIKQISNLDSDRIHFGTQIGRKQGGTSQI